MRIRLTNKIRARLNDNGDIDTLKSECLKATRLERGLVTGAEQKANLPATTIGNFLRGQKEKKSVEFWLEFVTQNFDSIYFELNEKRKRQEKELASDDNVSPNRVLITTKPTQIADEVRNFQL